MEKNRIRDGKIFSESLQLKIKSNLRGRGDNDEAARLRAQEAGIGGQQRGRELNPTRQALQGGRRPSGQHRDSSRWWRGAASGDESGSCGKERILLVGYFLRLYGNINIIRLYCNNIVVMTRRPFVKLKLNYKLKNQEPRAKSQEPRAKSQEPRANSKQQTAKNKELKTYYWVQERARAAAGENVDCY
jgi:hypothetical protein